MPGTNIKDGAPSTCRGMCLQAADFPRVHGGGRKDQYGLVLERSSTLDSIHLWGVPRTVLAGHYILCINRSEEGSCENDNMGHIMTYRVAVD